MGRRRREGASKTPVILLATGAIIAVWCILTPTLLLNQIQQESSLRDILQKHGGSRASHSDPPAVAPLGTRLWTLEDATSDETAGKDWYELGKLITSKNRLYLHQAKGRATKPSSNITLVSGMFDLGRGDLPDSFKRTFDQYVERFSRFLAYKFPKILFIQPEHYQYYVPYLEQNPDYPVYIINTTIQDIKNFEYYDLIQSVRQKPGWASQAGWLAESPQASMALYNPMVMSKILWTRNAARINPFNTDSFLWIDGGHNCNNPERLTQENTQVFKDHFDKLLITYFDYLPHREVHGFTAEPFKKFCNTRDQVVRVGRGGIFGGTKEYLEVASEVYMLSLGATLTAGYMGTEENIFSLLYYRFPELVHDYENGEGGNCAIFTEAINGPPPPPLVDIIQEIGFDLRGLDCTGTYDDIKCYDGATLCPSYVTPTWLTEAAHQYACTLPEYFCTVSCTNSGVYWSAQTCEDVENCPPHGRVPYSVFYGAGQQEESEVHVHALTAPIQVEEPKEPRKPKPNMRTEKTTPYEVQFTRNVQKKYSEETTNFIQKHGYDLRGLECEIKDGKETCFLNHRLGRDICPSYVTADFLSLADGQPACHGKGMYCVVSCQDGTPKIIWTAYSSQYCKENPDYCAPEPHKVSFTNFALHEWSEPPREPWPCENIPVSRFSDVDPFTVLVLARGNEIETLSLAVESWAAGFMQAVPEFLFFINEQSQEMLDYLEPYTKSPYNAKIRTSDENVGILKGISWLIGNSTYEHVLFLEKDFRLVESVSCALDQIRVGTKLLNEGTADVVKYRSRYNGGKPNWADILYRDQEETVFARQPNLLCNFYHWIDHPENRWPNQFKICHEDPLMYCVDAEFCNWTNNPFFIKKSWWIENYEEKHWEIRNPPEQFDLETWMNWDPDAWNHRGWTIAEGDGMFRHSDTNKFGV